MFESKITPTVEEAAKNLKLLRDSFAENHSKYELDMSSFVDVDQLMNFGVQPDEYDDIGPNSITDFLKSHPNTNLCGTSCCLVGYSAISNVPELRPEEGEDDFDEYSERLFVPAEYYTIWDFLFGGNRRNEVNYAINRMDFFIGLLNAEGSNWEFVREFVLKYNPGKKITVEDFNENWKEYLDAAIRQHS